MITSCSAHWPVVNQCRSRRSSPSRPHQAVGRSVALHAAFSVAAPLPAANRHHLPSLTLAQTKRMVMVTFVLWTTRSDKEVFEWICMYASHLPCNIVCLQHVLLSKVVHGICLRLFPTVSGRTGSPFVQKPWEFSHSIHSLFVLVSFLILHHHSPSFCAF